MILMTKAIEKKIPNLYGQSGMDARVYLKLFTPWSNWTWYATEYEPETQRCFGYVKGFEAELGYFDLNELAEVEGPWGMKVERDMHWNDKNTLADVEAGRAS